MSLVYISVRFSLIEGYFCRNRCQLGITISVGLLLIEGYLQGCLLMLFLLDCSDRSRTRKLSISRLCHLADQGPEYDAKGRVL